MAFLPDFVFAFDKVVVELVDELLAFVQSHDVPLSAIVTLVLDHLTTFLGGDHVHDKSLSFDFGLVNLTGSFLWCEDGLSHLFQIFKRFQLVLACQLLSAIICLPAEIF